MSAWAWVGAGGFWLVIGVVFWRLGVKHARASYAAGRLDEHDQWVAGAADREAATFRAAATVTRAAIAARVDELSSLRCGGGHADHVKRSDVRRIVAGEPHA